MAYEHRVAVDTTYSAPVYVSTIVDPNITGVYSFVLIDSPGVVGANNYVALVNPPGSGKSMAVVTSTVSSYLVSGGSTARASMSAYRATYTSGGTAQAAAAIAKARTSMPNSAATIYTGNPTMTIGAGIIAFPPVVSGTTAVQSDRVVAAAGAAPVAAPGESIVFRAADGDTDQTWNIQFAWMEF